MKEEGFNPNAVITDQVIDALANIQDHEPGSFREHTEKLTDILLDDFELMEPDNLKRNLDLVQFFRFYAGLIGLHRCLIDGFEWEAQPNNILQGTGCPQCAQNLRNEKRTKTHEDYVAELSKKIQQ